MEELLTFMWANEPFYSTRSDTYFEKVKMLNKEERVIIIKRAENAANISRSGN